MSSPYRPCPASGRAERSRVLDRAVDRHFAGDVHHCGEGLEGDEGDGLEDLLVAPPGLARLLVEVHGRASLTLDERLEIAQEDGLAVIAGVELARERELVETEA